MYVSITLSLILLCLESPFISSHGGTLSRLAFFSKSLSLKFFKMGKSKLSSDECSKYLTPLVRGFGQ